MEISNKKYRRDAASVVCYVLAVIMLLYTCYTAGDTISQINAYYASYGMTAKPMEYVTYVFQNAITPLFNAIVFFMLGYILDAVRKADPANYMTDDELREAKEAKKAAKEAKKIAKGEKAAAKAGHTTGDEASVAADFASDLDKELRADEEKADEKKADEEIVLENNADQDKAADQEINADQNKKRRQGGNRNKNYYRKNNNNRNNHNNRNNNQNKDQDKPKTEAEDNGPKESGFSVEISEDN